MYLYHSYIGAIKYRGIEAIIFPLLLLALVLGGGNTVMLNFDLLYSPTPQIFS